MVILNVLLVHRCYLLHLSKGTARMRYDKDTDEERKIRVNMERGTAGSGAFRRYSQSRG